LYSFTKLPAEFYLSTLFEEAWRPLLVYMEEVYAPPLSLSGLHDTSIDSFSSEEEKPTLFHEETRLYDFKSSVVYTTFQMIDRKASLRGFITKLTVNIPKSQYHQFWKRLPQDFSAWEIESEMAELSFQVERWGLSKEDSYHHAVQRAKNIIACLRMAVSKQMQVIDFLGVELISPLTIPQCPALSLGHQLNDLWKARPYPESSSITSWSEENTDTLTTLLETKINSDSLIEIRLLLQYYQVYS
jgi:hypothetical protein